jgi:hypothetical protein
MIENHDDFSAGVRASCLNLDFARPVS